MAFPTLTAAGARLYEQFEHLEIGDPSDGSTPADLGYPIAHLCAALAAPVDRLYDLFATGDSAWQFTKDVDTAPGWLLPWLAQFNGVPAGALRDLPEDRQREVIRDAAGKRRGTVAAFTATAKLRLTGLRTVILVENVDDDPYHVAVITRTSETPFPDLTYRDLMAAKPAGLILDIFVTDLELWLDVDPAVTWTTIDPTLTWADFDGPETIHA